MKMKNAAPFVVFLALVACGSESRRDQQEEATDQEREPLNQEPERITVDGVALYGEFREDRDMFREKYGHETPVRVTGHVRKLDLSTKSVYLDIGESGIGPSGEPEELVCNPLGTINPAGRWAEFRELEAGDAITINAACCAPGDDTVLMVLCSLVSKD